MTLEFAAYAVGPGAGLQTLRTTRAARTGLGAKVAAQRRGRSGEVASLVERRVRGRAPGMRSGRWAAESAVDNASRVVLRLRALGVLGPREHLEVDVGPPSAERPDALVCALRGRGRGRGAEPNDRVSGWGALADAPFGRGGGGRRHRVNIVRAPRAAVASRRCPGGPDLPGGVEISQHARFSCVVSRSGCSSKALGPVFRPPRAAIALASARRGASRPFRDPRSRWRRWAAEAGGYRSSPASSRPGPRPRSGPDRVGCWRGVPAARGGHCGRVAASRRTRAPRVPAGHTDPAIKLLGMNPPTFHVTGKGYHTGSVLLRRDGTVPPLRLA